MATDIWRSRDLPVLEAIVRMTDEGADGIMPSDIAARVGIPEGTVQAALRGLSFEDPPYFESSSVASGEIVLVANPTGHARRAVGSWPSSEALAASLTQALATAADEEHSPEERAKLKALARWCGSAGRDILINIIASAIARSGGLG